MTALVHSLIKYLLPPLVLDVGRLVRAHLRSFGVSSQLRTNNIWRFFHKGQHVYIIGNGPSIGDFDLSELRGQKVIVMNNFHLAAWKNDVDIVAHCIAEPWASPSWDRDQIRAAILGTSSRTYWLDISSLGKLGNLGINKSLHYALPVWEPGLWGDRPIRLDQGTLVYQTTAQLAIQVGLFMGFREITLLGFDHDWLASPDYSRHFYSTEKDSTDKLGQMSYLQIILFMQRMWEIYGRLEATARRGNARIQNASAKTYLDIFERRL
jgi:hypothetical protein